MNPATETSAPTRRAQAPLDAADAVDRAPALDARLAGYRLRFAHDDADREAIYRLRYQVFNVELDEGLAASVATGLDVDEYDPCCSHALVETTAGEVVGTYRFQTAEFAARGFYSASEFDLAPLAAQVADAVEMGRACIARGHRSNHVLFLLWRAMLLFARHHGKRYLFGCSSLTSRDPNEGLAAERWLAANGHVHAELSAPPLPHCRCAPAPGTSTAAPAVEIPALFSIYLRYGAKIVSPPAIDRAFGTIDFLTLIDLDAVPARVRRHFEGA